VCRWCVTYRWKDLDKGYNFTLDLISIWGLHPKLWAPKVARVPTLAISGLPFGSPGTKCHLDMGLVERCRIYYKGEGGGFPQVRVVVNLVSPSHPWVVLAPKVFQLCTNHLVLVLCRPVWVSEACQFFLVPSYSSSTLSKCCEPGSVPRFLALPVFSVWNSHLSPSRSWERVKWFLWKKWRSYWFCKIVGTMRTWRNIHWVNKSTLNNWK
jgi:hypothetical protein